MGDESLSLDLFGDGEGRSEAVDETPPGPLRDQAAPARETSSPGPSRPAAGEPERSTPEAAPEVEVWTVSQVNRAVRNLLERTLPPLWVSGEVGGWKRARSGHCYFTLKDDQAQIRAVMFRTEAGRLPTDPGEGMEVRVFGSLTLYEGRGDYQLVVRRLEAAGEEGLWRLAFEKLRRKLDSEGLLAAERKRPIPRFPEAVGVVTSATGAAIRDVLTVIRRRAPWTRVVVRSTRVQGDGAALEVAAAVRLLGRSGLVDVLIVGRGGGSVEDLWAFNEEAVARAIAGCPVPVISAVGHEVDVTISDLVADLRAPTPSAAAEAAVQEGGVLRSGLRDLPARLSRALRGAVARRRGGVFEGRERLERAVDRLLQPRRVAVDRGLERLERSMRTALERRRRALSSAAGRLEALSPLSTLRRGYAVPLDPEGRVLRSVGMFLAGMPFVLRVVDGRVGCEVLETHTDREGNGDGES
ncbi:MAG TPA: exodeoxyribonuclease VII large subunit [Longimicrobiales bacterium]|nr:exodeoxyribonuclease VII large subunit [Longimicrobiales bacterium]